MTEESLRSLLEKGGDENEHRLLFHLLAVCPGCHAVGGYLLELYDRGAIELQFSVIDVDLARSRAEAPTLLAELAAKSFEDQEKLIAMPGRFRTWGLCEGLCRESKRIAPRSPAEAARLARLAVTMSLALEEWEPAEAHWLFELRALAWAHLGYALRVSGSLGEAECAFVEAEHWWEPGAADVGDILGYEAQILDLKASGATAEPPRSLSSV